MKYKDLIGLDELKEAKIVIFNTEYNWHFIDRKSLYKVDREFDNAFYSFAKGEVGWNFIEKRMRILYKNDPKVKPLCYIHEFELEEDIDNIYLDGVELKDI